ncbi:MAG: helix-turn-helix domain-containing protein [Bacteroidaceae bacterium]|nr:helix-turn-helix domain-containing protein [Prevotellaceae bacterium]MDY5632801.1 helix-turn-helix domain-containing protein [Bacteroidaceae bacterium]
MRSTFKVLFYLKKNAPKKNGSVPVMCRVTIDGTIAQFSCKCDIHPDLWDDELSRLLHINRRTLQDYRNMGRISFIKLGGKVLYREEDVEKLLQENYRPRFEKP